MNIDIIAALTLQEEKILHRAFGSSGEGTVYRPPCSKLGWKAPFSVFLRSSEKML